ncbi:polyphosphate kinase 2 [Colwellia piezophila]|uniref:polyphosphate kinase 2 n=1 Tax=Colwellia piezophila TaxID=211668 RepID=UPI00037F25F5|nr:polyphosphate kinase 2 [Colwellia piezophila]
MGSIIRKSDYEQSLEELQSKLIALQEWVKRTGQKVVIVFEGRDAAGKGGVIKAMMERVSPRVFRVEALPAPSDREKTQMYAQRYIECFPSAGEIVIFDRSWYNRAGVESVMGFCSELETEQFLLNTPLLEEEMVREGIILLKYWLDVSSEEQEKRIRSRIDTPTKHWKLSALDLDSRRYWYQYSKARDRMLEATDTQHAPWFIVDADDKRKARLNCISHILETIPYEELPEKEIYLPVPELHHAYNDKLCRGEHNFVAQVY